jgi:hypothetical protein
MQVLKNLSKNELYEADSPPALALQQQIDRTKARFDKYGRSDYYVEQMVYHI